MTHEQKAALVETLEGEIMLASFNGYHMPEVEARLIELLKDIEGEQR